MPQPKLAPTRSVAWYEHVIKAMTEFEEVVRRLWNEGYADKAAPNEQAMIRAHLTIASYTAQHIARSAREGLEAARTRDAILRPAGGILGPDGLPVN